MSFICLLKKISFGLLFLVISVIPAFGMGDLVKLSHEEASKLWLGGALTTIHKIEISHNNKIYDPGNMSVRPIKFDRSGRHIQVLYLGDKYKEYRVIYDILTKEEVDVKGRTLSLEFIPSDKDCKRYISNSVYDLTKGDLVKYNIINHDWVQWFVYDFYEFFRYVLHVKKQTVLLGSINGCDFENIAIYDLVLKKLVYVIPVKRNISRKLAINHNNSMIAYDTKDTIVILYPQLLNFLKFKINYDININYE